MEKNKNVDQIPDDILYHLGLLMLDCTNLKLDYNRDLVIQFKIESINRKIATIVELYQRNDTPIFRAVKNKINNMVVNDPNLKGIIIHAENSRCKSELGKIEKFKIQI